MDREPEENLLQHLEKSELLSVLPTHELQALALSARRRAFEVEQILFSEGDRNSSIFVIAHGSVRLSRTNRSGKTLVLRTVARGYVLGQMSALDGSPHSVSAQAEDAVTVLAIPRRAYLAALERTPAAALALARILGDIVRSLSAELGAMKFASIESRLLARLIMRARNRREIRITHAELAAEAGSTRENATRILGRLERQKIVRLGRGRIEILDHAALAVFHSSDEDLL